MLPAKGALDLSGLDVSDGLMDELLKVDAEEWKPELPDLEKHFAQFGDKAPARLLAQLEAFKKRLG